MITLKKNGYTKNDLDTLKKVIRNGLYEDVPCNNDCDECANARVCSDLCRLEKYVTSVLNTVN